MAPFQSPQASTHSEIISRSTGFTHVFTTSLNFFMFELTCLSPSVIKACKSLLHCSRCSGNSSRRHQGRSKILKDHVGSPDFVAFPITYKCVPITDQLPCIIIHEVLYKMFYLNTAFENIFPRFGCSGVKLIMMICQTILSKQLKKHPG